MIKAADRLNTVSTYYFAKKLEEIRQLNESGRKVINLGIGSPDLDPPKSVSQALIQGLESDNAHQYQSYLGTPTLRNAFAHFYQKQFGVKLNPNSEILPLIGSKEGIMHISMSFLNPGDEVLIPNPGYPAYRMCSLLAGAKPRFYELDEKTHWLPQIEKLEEQDLSAVKIMWINYPHMPTGASCSTQDFQLWIEFAKKHDILLCHDNPYSFILNEERYSALASSDATGHVLELCSLSKCFNMAGWRVGAVLGHADLISTILKFKSNMDSGMFKPVQLAAANALLSEDSWFDNLNEIYKQRRIKAWELLNLLNVQFDKKGSGMFVWAKVKEQVAEKLSNQILKETKVFITPGFIFGSAGEQYLRISLCNDVAIFDEAIERIKQWKS